MRRENDKLIGEFCVENGKLCTIRDEKGQLHLLIQLFYLMWGIAPGYLGEILSDFTLNDSANKLSIIYFKKYPQSYRIFWLGKNSLFSLISLYFCAVLFFPDG